VSGSPECEPLNTMVEIRFCSYCERVVGRGV
jgi:hypothetical protein